MTQRFLDPTNDIVFRRIFGDETHTVALISLINAVLELEGDRRVVSVSVVGQQVLPMMENFRDTLVDVRATDATGQQFIVEMQCKGGSTWMKRAIYNTSKAYVNQLKPSAGHDRLHPVYFIGILDFQMAWRDVLLQDPPRRARGPIPIDERGGRHWLTHHVLMDRESGLQSSNDISLHFMELPVFNKTLEECHTVVEQWAWFFKNAPSAQSVPVQISDPGISSAFHIAEEHGWSEEQLHLITNMALSRMVDREERLLQDRKLQASHDAGKAEGELEKAKKITLRLAARGMPIADIAHMTDVDEATVRAWLSSGDHPSA